MLLFTTIGCSTDTAPTPDRRSELWTGGTWLAPGGRMILFNSSYSYTSINFEGNGAFDSNKSVTQVTLTNYANLPIQAVIYNASLSKDSKTLILSGIGTNVVSYTFIR